MFCTQCGKQLNEGTKFCTGCGNPVRQKAVYKETVNVEKHVTDAVSEPDEKTEVFLETEYDEKTEAVFETDVQNHIGQEKEADVNNTESTVLLPAGYSKNISSDDQPPVIPIPINTVQNAASDEQWKLPEYPAKKNGKGGLIALIIILVILILAASGAAFWFLGGKDIIFDYFDIETENTSRVRHSSSHDDDDDDEKSEEASLEDTEEVMAESPEETTEVAVAAEEPEEAVEEAVEGVVEEEEPEEAEEPEEEEIPSEYIIEDSDVRVIDRRDLDQLTARECMLARNELYARHGRLFQNQEIQDYFNSCSWYNGTIPPEKFKESMLNDVETQNRDFIVEYEKKMGYK